MCEAFGVCGREAEREGDNGATGFGVTEREGTPRGGVVRAGTAEGVASLTPLVEARVESNSLLASASKSSSK